VPRRIRFYLDEHVAFAVASGLRRRGVDVATAREVGLLSAPDEEHIALARARGLVIFTQDVDFLRLHAAGLAHTGIAYAPQRTPIGAIVRGLMLIYQILDADDMRDHVEFL
jgi:hypothetical protein